MLFAKSTNSNVKVIFFLQIYQYHIFHARNWIFQSKVIRAQKTMKTKECANLNSTKMKIVVQKFT